jgi:hypothetical protein
MIFSNSIRVRTNIRVGQEPCNAWDTNCWAAKRGGSVALDANGNPVFRNCNHGYPMAGEVCWMALAAAGYDILAMPPEVACLQC